MTSWARRTSRAGGPLMGKLRLGEWLVRWGQVSSKQVDVALEYQKGWGCPLGEALVALDLLDAETVQRGLSRLLGVPFVRGEEVRKVSPAVVRMVPHAVLRRLGVFPLRLSFRGARGELHVATHRPQDLALMDAVAFATGLKVHPVLAVRQDIEDALEQHGVTGGGSAAGPSRGLSLAWQDDGDSFQILRGIEG
ncbi:MAG: pilus assembly protein PilB [Myxococcaceae bacterium]|nr:MAG: pilus assembly protein PilB [Myxococcaceae bacterium]